MGRRRRAALSGAGPLEFQTVLGLHASVTMYRAGILLIFAGLLVAEESADFSKSVQSDADFRKSVVYGGAQENDVNSANSGEFLRNFKKVSNETDLEAVPSEVSADQVDRADTHTDTGTRVLRGAHHSHLDIPLFQVNAYLLSSIETHCLRLLL